MINKYFYKHKYNKFIISFTGNMASLLSSGINLLDALDILKENHDKQFQSKINSVIKNIKNGKSLDESFKSITNDKSFLTLVKIGQETDTLAQIFSGLNERYTFTDSVRKETVGLLIYPVIVMLVAISIFGVMLKFVIPNFSNIYTELDQELPLSTRFILKLSSAFNNHFSIVVVSLLFIIMLMRYLTIKNKEAVLRKIFGIPFIGKIIKEVEVLYFTQSMYMLIDSNIYITRALQILSISEKGLLKKELIKIRKKLEKGNNISKAFENLHYFDSEYKNYLSIGDKTGDISSSFFHLKNLYHKRVNEKIKLFFKIFEPLSIIFIAIIVGFMVFAIMTPILKMGENL